MPQPNLVTAPAGQSATANGPLYGIRILVGQVGQTFQFDSGPALALPITGELHPPNWERSLEGCWGQLVITAPASGPVVVELQTSPHQRLGESGTAPVPANLDANGNLKVVPYVPGGVAAPVLFGYPAVLTAGDQGNPFAQNTSDNSAYVTSRGSAGSAFAQDADGATVQGGQATQIWTQAAALAPGDTTVYFSSTGVKGTTPPTAYDLSKFTALALLFKLTGLAGGAAPTVQPVINLDWGLSLNGPAFAFSAVALSAQGVNALVQLARGGTEATGGAAGTGTWALSGRLWQKVYASLIVTGAPTTLTGSLTLFGVK